MSQIRTSTVPNCMCGRTSHQISRVVRMNPVSTMWPISQRYSLQLRISGGRPAAGSPSMTLTRCECSPVARPFQNGLLAERARSVGRWFMIRSQTMIALSPLSTPTWTCRPKVASRRAVSCISSTSSR